MPNALSMSLRRFGHSVFTLSTAIFPPFNNRATNLSRSSTFKYDPNYNASAFGLFGASNTYSGAGTDAYPNDKILQVYWTGVRYTVLPPLDLTASNRRARVSRDASRCAWPPTSRPRDEQMLRIFCTSSGARGAPVGEARVRTASSCAHASLDQIIHDQFRGFLRGQLRGVDADFRGLRSFIRTVDPREILELAAPGFLVQPLDVA